MDIFTQGLLGAAFAQSAAKSTETRLATLVGFCAPLLADADALIQSAEDPLVYLDYHRHFSHSLLFIPIGALLAVLLLWPLLRNRIGFARTYLFALFGYATAGVLDACTSYGTHLLWPFSDQRIAWSIISIFDPLFSLTLLVAIIFAAIKYRPRVAQFGIGLAVAYLMLGVLQQQRAETVILQLAQQRGHTIERLVVKPTLGNLILWRSVYETQGHYHVDAVRVGIPGNEKVISGSQVQAFSLQKQLPQLPAQTTMYQDIQRFERFSDGFLAWHPDQPNVLGDVRYAMLPTSIHPLWGIELNLDRPDQHVAFNTYRTLDKTERTQFINMLLD